MTELIDVVAGTLERLGPAGWPVLAVVYLLLRERTHDEDKRDLQGKLFGELESRTRLEEQTRNTLEKILDAIKRA